MVSRAAEPLAKVFQSLPTSTANQARLQVYQPTRRPTWQSRVIENAWGRATIRGKVGQVHADIVESICRLARDHRLIEQTGHLQVLVDPYQVRLSVGGGKPYSADTLWNMLTELREVSITVEIPSRGIKVLGGILDRVEESPATEVNPLTRQERHLWRVTFDPAFAALFANDLALNYDPAPLAKIETGVAQAVARHILTHRNAPQGGWKIDALIDQVGAGGDSTTVRNRRRDIHKCAESLASVGLRIEGDRILH